MSDRTEALTQATAPANTADGSYVDWPAIFAGAAVASAIAFVFAGFGAALGLSFISPYAGEGFATAAIVAAASWMLWTTISSFMAGGYLAGRLRRRVDAASADEVDIRDGAHGLVVWAVGVIVGAMMLSSAVSTSAKIADTTASAVTSAAGTVVEGAASAAGTVAETAASAAPMDYITNAMFRGDGAPRSQGALAIREEAKQVLMNVLRTGDVPDADREYLVTVASNQTNLDEATINARVDDAITAAQDARAELAETAAAAEKALADAEQTARDTAEAARVYSILSAFALAAALLIAGAGAYWAAGVGGRHRDEGRMFAGFGRWE